MCSVRIRCWVRLVATITKACHYLKRAGNFRNRLWHIRQKFLQTRDDFCFGFASPAFPDGECLPAGFSKLTHVAAVAFAIPRPFGLPEFSVRFRSNSTVPATMHVPEASVNKNDFVVPRQDKVRFSGQVFSVKAKSESHLMHQTSHNHFRFRILAADTRHVERSLRC